MLNHDNMSAKPIQISLDEEFVARIDSDPEVQARGRSAFIRAAIELYLRARHRAAIDERIAQAYRQDGDAMVQEIQHLLGGQTWPDE